MIMRALAYNGYGVDLLQDMSVSTAIFLELIDVVLLVVLLVTRSSGKN
jgi:hypothetical protein